MGHGEVLRTSSLVGSVHYLAPEVVSGDSYDVMADWWAFGVLLYDMFVSTRLSLSLLGLIFSSFSPARVTTVRLPSLQRANKQGNYWANIIV